MDNRIIKVSRNTEKAPVSPISTQSVAFSHYNNISAQLPIDPATKTLIVGGIEQQAKQCLKNIKMIVNSIEHTMSDVVRINVYLKNITDLDKVNEVYASFFPLHRPTYTSLAVADLPMKGALVQMDAVISNGEGTYPQDPCDLVKLTRNSVNAPITPLSSQTVAFSHYNHISAQLPIEPKSGNVVTGGIKEQTQQCLRNIKTILESIDVPMDDIVKTNIHITKLEDLEAVDEVYKTFFPDSSIARAVNYLPARSSVVVEGLALDALVQIDATVSHGDGTPPQLVEDRHGIVIKATNTEKAPLNALSTQSVAFSHYNNISAQLPIDPSIGKIVASGTKEQVMQCFENIKAIVENIDHVMDDIVKLNIQLKDMNDLCALEEVLRSYFNDSLPALTVIGVSSLPSNSVIQIDAIMSNAEGTPPNK
ncbi:RidA family protein [Vibrio mediterranei]|uniref:Reactive intermediate/imine deaminase n=1 Tax=Vibrio mediterranei TaxID=689 RepID=A0AAN1FGR3_9VIBR|nr:RidA family protein [Vibrio mediterranei]ASI90317.1 reactive intermediate/imine deaminase [Vibrio mediterranei]